MKIMPKYLTKKEKCAIISSMIFLRADTAEPFCRLAQNGDGQGPRKICKFIKKTSAQKGEKQ